jgi:hypothetical protein
VLQVCLVNSADAVSSECRYGGSYETEKREYTLDDFFALNLEKRDGYKVLRETVLDAEVWHGSDDEDQMDEDDDGEDDDSEEESSEADE